MEMQPVSSSNVAAVGFESSDPENSETGTLRVEFKSGSTYDYQNVPQSTFDALVSAESVGRAFNQLVKNVYVGSRV